MAIFNRLSIQSKLMLIVLLTSIASIALIGYIGYSSGRENLTQTVFNQLTSLRAAKAAELQAYFDTLEDETLTISESPMATNAMRALKTAYFALNQEDLTPDQNQRLEAFYRESFIPNLAVAIGGQPLVEAYLPQTVAQRYLQYHYIAANPDLSTNASLLEDAGDGTAYSQAHAQFHPAFKNFSRPTPRHVKTFNMRFSLEDPPYKARQVLYDTAFETEGVLKDPAPIIRTISYDDFSITYLVILFFESFEQSLSAPDAFVTRLWYSARRYGLTIPYPVKLQGETAEATPSPAENRERVLSVLREMPLLRNLDQSAITHIASIGQMEDYAQGETILKTGNPVPGLYVVIQGQMEMSQPDATGEEIRISQLSVGDYFGEESSVLGNQLSEVTVRAETDVQLLMLNEALLEPLVDHNPRLATEIGEVMEIRRRKRRTLQRLKADGTGELYGNQNGSVVRSGSD
jgi:hypothetical protein